MSSDSLSVSDDGPKRQAIRFPDGATAPDYQNIVEKRNVQTIFDTYLEVFELMIKMEPKLMKDAVKTIK